MGYYVFGPWLLKMAGVANELWRIQDYDSDLLVICLASKRTIEKLVNTECNDNGIMEVTWASLFLMREMMFGVNAKYIRHEEIFVYAWYSTLWLTSFNKYDTTTWTNKRNMVMKKNGI